MALGVCRILDPPAALKTGGNRMSDRIDHCLDGELARDDLDGAERARVEAFDSRVSQLRDRLTARSPSDLPTRVMRRIEELGLEPLPAERPGALRRTVASLWAVRETQVQWRPAYALAAAAALVMVLAAPWLSARSSAPGRGAATRADEGAVGASRLGAGAADVRIFVQFRLHAADASDVALAGSFSGWEPTVQLQETTPGVWSVLLPLTPGVHDYAFVVDGDQWVPDPLAPHVDDGFGGINSRLAVLAPATL
jgi:hypothetical protein